MRKTWRTQVIVNFSFHTFASKEHHMLHRRWLLALGALILINQNVANPAYGTITLGISVTTGNLQTNTRVQQGARVLRGLHFWLHKINSTVEIRGKKYQLGLKVLEDNGTIQSVLDNYVSFINDSGVDYLLGPIGSDLSSPLSNFLNGQPRLILGSSASSSQFIEANPYALSVVTTASRCPLVSFPYFRLVGARKIAFIISQSISAIESCGDITDVQVSGE